MYENELKTAISAVKKAEPTFRKYFGTQTNVQSKSGDYRNLVSYADKKIETDIKKFLMARFPDYGFIGEEHGTSNGGAEFVWALDPIDGTTNYLHALPDCTIALGLLRRGRPVLGVVFAPLHGNIYTAAKGRGAFRNGKRIRASKVGAIRNAFGAFGWGKEPRFAARHFPSLVRRTLKLRVAGSAALTFCQVADGTFDFFYGNIIPNVWDYAAGQIILEEAGGRLLTSKNAKTFVAANPALGKKFLKFTF